MRSKFIQSEIIHELSDFKLHKTSDIANKLELSRMTVYRHIIDLSFHYPILTFCGGRDSGGVKLDKSCLFKDIIFTFEQKAKILQALELLQNTNGEDLHDLIQYFSTSRSIKGEINKDERQF